MKKALMMSIVTFFLFATVGSVCPTGVGPAVAVVLEEECAPGNAGEIVYDQWVHVVGVLRLDKTDPATPIYTSELYVDGQLDATSASTDEPIDTAGDGVVRIGESPWHTTRMPGELLNMLRTPFRFRKPGTL